MSVNFRNESVGLFEQRDLLQSFEDSKLACYSVCVCVCVHLLQTTLF